MAAHGNQNFPYDKIFKYFSIYKKGL